MEGGKQQPMLGKGDTQTQLREGPEQKAEREVREKRRERENAVLSRLPSDRDVVFRGLCRSIEGEKVRQRQKVKDTGGWERRERERERDRERERERGLTVSVGLVKLDKLVACHGAGVAGCHALPGGLHRIRHRVVPCREGEEGRDIVREKREGESERKENGSTETSRECETQE
jgi:hypothetical protein